MRNNFKKVVAASVLVVVGVFAAPMAANAAGYVPTSNIIVTGAVVPGGTNTATFTAGSFTGGETVSFSLTGQDAAGATLAAATTTVTATKVANADGSVVEKVTLPSDASGTYTLTATGLTSGNVGTASLTVVPADAGSASSSGDLAFTGSTVSMLVVWGAGGAVVLGIAFMVVLALVRRQQRSTL